VLQISSSPAARRGHQPYGCDKAARLGVEIDAIVNTMPADDLVAWAASHPTD